MPFPSLFPMGQPKAQPTPANQMGMLDRLNQWNAANPGLLVQVGNNIAQGQTPFAGTAEIAASNRQMMEGRKRENVTKSWLMTTKGLSDQEAEAAIASPEILNHYLKGGEKKLHNVGGALYDENSGEWITPPEGIGRNDENFFGTPIYGTDPEGNTVIGQIGNRGSFRQMPMPEGFEIANGVDKIDVGTHYVLQDKRTGQTVGTLPKENFQEAYDTGRGSAEGKAAGEAKMQSSQAVATADQILASIDAVANDPNLDYAVGVFGVAPAVPGTSQAGVISRIEQIQGQAFLQAFETLKGGGQITEREGQVATQAIARLKRTQNKEDFLQALGDLRAIVEGARARALQRGGASVAPAADEGWQDMGDGVRIRQVR